MKRIAIAAALLAAFGAAQAQSEGSTTNNAKYRAGGSTFPTGHFHGPFGAPGIGFAGASGYVISLQSIDSFSYKGSDTVSGNAFRRYQLLGYSHSDPANGNITANFNWYKVPAISQQVYFGLVTDTVPATPVHDAFYVGDRTGYAVPTVNTSYAAAGLLAVPATSASDPVKLAGTLSLTAAGAPSLLSGSLSGSNTATPAVVHTLSVSATNFTTIVGGFTGTSTYSRTGGGSGAGSAEGKFFGSGATSALAGIAKGGSGANAYVASFGGIKN